MIGKAQWRGKRRKDDVGWSVVTELSRIDLGKGDNGGHQFQSGKSNVGGL